MSYTKEEILTRINEKNTELYNKYGKSKLSISKLLDYIKEPFDKEGVSLKTFNKHYDDKNSEYYHMTQQQILEKWESKGATSIAYGNQLDDYIELTLTNSDKLELWKLDNDFDDDERLNGICTGFDQFNKIMKDNTDYIYIGSEIPLLYVVNDIFINGRTDYLGYSPSQDKFLIIDWKNSEKIDMTNKWQRMKGPFKQYDDCDGNRYTLQVQYYKTCLANTYGFDIPENRIDVRVVQMLPKPNENGNNFNAYKENIPYSKENIDKLAIFGNKKYQLIG